MENFYILFVFLQFIIFKFNNIKQKKFEQIFGVHCLTAAYLYTIVNTYNPSIHPLWVLQFLHWIRQYPTNAHATFFWDIDVKTWRSHILQVLYTLFIGLNMVCDEVKKKGGGLTNNSWFFFRVL